MGPNASQEEHRYYAFQRWAWRAFAPLYDAVVFVPFLGLRREVVRLADLRAGARVLDVATGTGGQAFAFAGTAREVVGLDMSEAMLRIARRKNRFLNVTFQAGDASALPFADESFDASCVSFALHEMPDSIRKRVLSELVRVTKPGGEVIVVDYALPQRPAPRWLAYHLIKLYEGRHYATFTKLDLPALLEKAGLEIADREPLLGGVAQVIVGRRRN